CTLSNHLDQPTLDSDFSQLRPPFQAIPVQTNHLTSLYQPCPSSASIATVVAGNLPRNRPGPTVFSKICGSSFSFVSQPNRSSKAPGARQKCKRDLRGSKDDSAEFSAEV
ncbi:hypothetical protein Prudu_017756, partial [Prunus dulcis]